MPHDIPQEQLDRISPVVEELRTRVRELSAELSLDDELALRFHPDGEVEP